MEPALAPFTVSLGATPAQSELDFGTRLGLTVDVNASVAVTRVELWDGSTLMGARVTKDPAGARRLHADFDWTAVSPGAHLLAARAVAVDGTPSWSRSIPVTVGLSTLSATGGAVAVPAEAGQTAADTAEQLGVDPASLVVPGPGGGTTAAESPDTPVGPTVQVLPPPVQGGDAPEPVKVDDGLATIEPGSTTTTSPVTTTSTPDTTPDTTTTAPATTVPATTAPITIAPVTTTPFTTTPVTTTTAPGDVDPLLIGGLVVMPVSVYLVTFPPSEPAFTFTLDGCNLRVTRSEPFDEPVSFARTDSGHPWLNNRGGMQKGEAEWVDDHLVPGIYAYVASIGNDEQQTTPHTVVVPSSCAAESGWSGSFSIINGVLTVPEPGNGYYVYIGPAATPDKTSGWMRIPEDDRAFIDAASTSVNVVNVLPNFLNIRDWSAELWRSDGVTAVKVADASLSVPGTENIDDIVGWGLTFDLKTLGGDRSIVLKKNTTQQFAWTADYGVNRVVWQVLAKPLPRTNTSLTPPGLLAVGVSETPPPNAGFGYFNFDTGKLPRTAPPDASVSSGGGGGSGGGSGKGFSLGSVPVQPPSLPDKGGVANYAEKYPGNVLIDPNPSSPLSVEEMFGAIDTAAGVAVYVRGVPMIGQQVTGIASPSVAMVMPDQPGVGNLSFQSVTLDAGRVPNPAWQRCAVVNVPWDDPSWVPPADVPADELAALKGVYATDGEYCRQDPPPQDLSWDEELWAVLEASGQQFVGFYDAAAAAYNDLVAYAAQAVADWNPICEALGGSAAQSCRDATKAMAAVAIKAALTFLGLPAALPTSGQLIASARAAMEADLSGFAAEWMQAVGIPCEDYAQDPSTYADAQKAAGKLGVSLNDPQVGEDGKVDLCRELAHALLDSFIAKAQASFNSQLSTSMGGPTQTVPIPGFEVTAHPAGRWNPMVVSVVAVPSQPGLDPSFVCTASVVNYWAMRHQYGTTVTLRHQPDGTWAGTALLDTLPDLASDVETLYSDMAFFGPTPSFSPEVGVGNDSCFGDQKQTATDLLQGPIADP